MCIRDRHGVMPRYTVAADFDGDGRTDLAAYTGSNSVWHVCFARGRDGNFECQYLTAHGGGFDNNATGDFDGDGRSDLAGYTGANNQWHVCNGRGRDANFECQYLYAHGGGAFEDGSLNNVAADFNGDGKTDLAAYSGSNNVWHVCLSTGNGFSCSY